MVTFADEIDELGTDQELSQNEHFRQSYFRYGTILKLHFCVIFVLFCIDNRNYLNSETSSFENLQGQKLPRNQRRLIPDA